MTNTIYLNNDVTYIRYLDYHRNLYYNKDIEMKDDDYWLAMLTAETYVELNEMSSHFLSDELRIKIVKDVIRLSCDEVIFDEYEQMVGDALINYEDELRAREEGIEYNKIETIKILLENNVDYQTISKASGKSIEEIKTIEESLN